MFYYEEVRVVMLTGAVDGEPVQIGQLFWIQSSPSMAAIPHFRMFSESPVGSAAIGGTEMSSSIYLFLQGQLSCCAPLPATQPPTGTR